MIIKSSTSLRNDYPSISSLAHENDEPIYITKNGEGDIVIMSIDAFEKREQALKLRYKLDASEQSRLNGDKTITVYEARKKLEEKYKNAEI